MPRQVTPEDLFPGVVNVESTWNPKAVGPKIPNTTERAIGLTQIMPSTGKKYGYKADQLTDPSVQWDVYTKHMGYLLKKYKYNPALALAAWNDGEKNVDKNSIAPRTADYVRSALKKTPNIRDILGGKAPDRSWINKMVQSDKFRKLTPEQKTQVLQAATQGK